MTAVYIDIEPDACAWTQCLIEDGLIAPGEVWCRSIKDIQPNELKGFTQVHAFCGISIWAYALRQAGWPDGRPIWTGSVPCTPFSVSGKQRGFDDPRDLWPDFFHLISARRPPVVMGEITAQKAGRAWFDRTRSDLEGDGYTSRACDIAACAVDAPHERSRLYWVAVEHAESERRRKGWPQSKLERGRSTLTSADAPSILGDTDESLLAQWEGERRDARQEFSATERADDTTVQSWWRDAVWITCHDGKKRRTQRGTPLLVDGHPGRIFAWKAAGNALCAPLAIEVIKAFMEGEVTCPNPTPPTS